jgi:hypothetical protein
MTNSPWNPDRQKLKDLSFDTSVVNCLSTHFPGLNPLSSVLYKKCYGNGICRLECYGSEMLVAYCMFDLECCIKGNPAP